ncbi:MAG: DDE-type integrase/transposase/recombinase [Blastocatellia bacterium]|nr:DDE-type integrase/transposase/recombinase [Blastocatellia bacterium]
MLSSQEFYIWCQHLGLTKEVSEAIDFIRSSPPARRVSSKKGNVSGAYPSRKMGRTIQFESHKNELAAILEYEYDPDVLEYFDQPAPPIKLRYQTKNGKEISVVHTPDFFVLRKQSAGWIECKTEDDLLQLTERQPKRYLRKKDGSWSCPPGELYSTELGLTYDLRSSAVNNIFYLRNIEFLEDYLRTETPLVLPEAQRQIRSFVQTNPGISLEQLLQSDQGITPDQAFSLIATQELWVDLHGVLLTDPKKTQVYSDRASAQEGRDSLPTTSHWFVPETGQSIIWDGVPWMVGNVGASTITLLGKESACVNLTTEVFHELARLGLIRSRPESQDTLLTSEQPSILEAADPESLREANRRYAIISAYLNGDPINSEQQSARAVYYWLAKYRQAEKQSGDGYLGLIPRSWQKGNRHPKLSENIKALMVEVIESQYENLKQRRMSEVYGALRRECELRGWVPPSYVTFTFAVKNRPRHQQMVKRQGVRAAYPEEAFFFELELSTPRHGDHPFHICHLDHTLLDVELVCSVTGQNLGRPWFSLLTDAFSRRILAVFISFDPPSYRSCMMTLRECVHRNGRLPQILVVDGGKEFESVYFETLLARYECTKKTRPGAKPRFGSVIERLFGTTNTQLIHNLTGNTQITKNVRQITKSVNPKNLAIWTLGRLYERLCEWAYEVYDTVEHPAFGQSPRDVFTNGLSQFGQRRHRSIENYSEFRILTLPTTSKGTARVSPGKGVKVNHIYYWNNAFRNPAIEQTAVPVRYDPYDAGTAYAYVGNRWVSCFSEHYTSFHGRSEKEMMLLSGELRQRQQNHRRKFKLTARKLADFLARVETDELLLSQQLKDKAAQSVFRLIEGGYAPTNADTVTPAPGNESANPEAETINYDKFEMYEEF